MNKIEMFRTQFNMTYSELSKKTGITSAYLYQLAKNKKNNPSKNVMEKISDAFHKTVPEVFYHEKTDA